MNKYYKFFFYGFFLFMINIPLDKYLISSAFMGYLFLAVGISHFEMYMNHGRRLQTISYINAFYSFGLMFAYPMFQDSQVLIFKIVFLSVFSVFSIIKVYLFFELMKFFEDITLVPDITLSENFNALKITLPTVLLATDVLLVLDYLNIAYAFNYLHILMLVFCVFVELRVLFNLNKLSKM